MIKHLLCDEESLANYQNGHIPEFDDIKRSLFLKQRAENNTIPDQHYHLIKEKSFNGITSLGSVITIGVYRLADEHLNLNGNRINVRQEKQNDWQQLITYMPPLFIQSIYLHIKKPLPSLLPEDLQEYFKEIILPNFKYTALPYPVIPHLEKYLIQKKGLQDLHVHLNGATETDISWQDYLRVPDKIFEEMEKAYSFSPKVKEQLEQESSLLNPNKYLRLLKIAQRIRVVLFDFIYGINELAYRGLNTQTLLNLIIATNWDHKIIANYKNPFQKIVPYKDYKDFPMPIEALMHVMVNRYLVLKNNDMIASIYHFYILILGLTNRLLVQQTHQYGFEQFQKHTLNGLREHSEKKYKQRFFQMHGNELRNICFIEGRISPKATRDDFLLMLKNISEGWQSLQKTITTQLLKDSIKGLSSSSAMRPKLNLIVHFIKRPDSKPNFQIRHKTLRKDIFERARILALVIRNQPNYAGLKITGVDAAASEFDASPEVFAPIFRLLRRSGVKHFTYHAGEDFYHILSGLRAVYEAAFFTGLCTGDRIGHATATGISPTHWLQIMGEKILIKRGEWLDNLIFVYYLIIKNNINELTIHLPNIANEIQKLYHQTYGNHELIETLIDAWKARKFCPMLLLSENLNDAQNLPVFDPHEWLNIRNNAVDANCLRVIKNYQSSFFNNRYNEPIEILTADLLDANSIHILQRSVLEYLHKKEIVIETLPTSNVRIGHSKDYGSYHLWNWFKLEKDGYPIPPIVIGTDDTGIFATNIFNEYANIYCHLTHTAGLPHHTTMKVIEQLDNNSSIYGFH